MGVWSFEVFGEKWLFGARPVKMAQNWICCSLAYTYPLKLGAMWVKTVMDLRDIWFFYLKIVGCTKVAKIP